LWQVSNGVAVRPDISFSATRIDGVDFWSYGPGLSGLFYVTEHDNLRSYVGPRLGYLHGGNASVRESMYSAGAFYGIQYAVVRRLGVFGEAGVTYNETRSSVVAFGQTPTPRAPTHSVAVGSGVGLVYYFR
jgi:hypothetical protein